MLKCAKRLGGDRMKPQPLNSISDTPFDSTWGNFILKDLAETLPPETISWLPQTLGWQLLFIAFVFFIMFKAYQAYKQYQRNAYRREALEWLAHCQKTNDIKLYKLLPALLRKTALAAFLRTEVTQLSGSAWENWLDSHCQQSNFSTLCPNLLHQIAFMPDKSSTIQTQQYQVLMAQIALWIKHHNRFDS